MLDGHSPRINGKKSQEEFPENVNESACNDLIKRILKERLEPTPEEPIHLGHDEEWNEHRPDEQENSLGDQPKANNHQHHRLNSRQDHVQHDERESLVEVDGTGLFHSLFHLSDLGLD